MKTLDHVKYSDLTAGQKELADLFGFDTFKDIVMKCGGSYLYIPKTEVVSRTARDSMIRQEFNGYNYKQLAQRYGLSEVWIRKIVKTEE